MNIDIYENYGDVRVSYMDNNGIYCPYHCGLFYFVFVVYNIVLHNEWPLVDIFWRLTPVDEQKQRNPSELSTEIILTHFFSPLALNVDGVVSKLVPPIREGMAEKVYF